MTKTDAVALPNRADVGVVAGAADDLPPTSDARSHTVLHPPNSRIGVLAKRTFCCFICTHFLQIINSIHSLNFHFSLLF